MHRPPDSNSIGAVPAYAARPRVRPRRRVAVRGDSRAHPPTRPPTYDHQTRGPREQLLELPWTGTDLQPRELPFVVVDRDPRLRSLVRIDTDHQSNRIARDRRVNLGGCREPVVDTANNWTQRDAQCVSDRRGPLPRPVDDKVQKRAVVKPQLNPRSEAPSSAHSDPGARRRGRTAIRPAPGDARGSSLGRLHGRLRNAAAQFRNGVYPSPLMGATRWRPLYVKFDLLPCAESHATGSPALSVFVSPICANGPHGFGRTHTWIIGVVSSLTNGGAHTSR